MSGSNINFSFRLSTATVGLAFAWVGMLAYATSNSIALLLVGIGEASPVAGGRNAITLANLLLLGSLISLVPMAALFHRDWTRENLRRLTRKDWMLLQASAVFSSAITPGLFFFALEHSNVTNVVLVSRIEPPLFLLAAGFFLRERIDPRALFAGMVALGGAIVMIGSRDTGWQSALGMGELAAAIATISYVLSAIVTRRAVRRVPMGIFSIYRTVVGTVFYVCLICALRGPETFQDVFSPVMLQWVWVYAVPVVVIGQMSWFIALKFALSGDISLATSFSPLAGIAFAIVLLGENPGTGFVPGAALILLSIAVGQMRWQRHSGLKEKWAYLRAFGALRTGKVILPAAK